MKHTRFTSEVVHSFDLLDTECADLTSELNKLIDGSHTGFAYPLTNELYKILSTRNL
jgi:hypothetical protein